MKFLKSQTFKKGMYLVLSFIMGLCILACSLLSVLKFTIFTPSFLIETLNNSDYYSDLCDEITDNLMDIGDASGLDKSFFEEFVDEVLVRKDVESYIKDFYSGKKLKADTLSFQRALRSALDSYESKNGISKSDFSESNVNYFVKEASDIYASNIELKYFPQIQKTVLGYSSKFTLIIIISAVVLTAVLLFVIFSNEWKHIAVRYIYYSAASAGLFTLAIPAVVFLSGIISRLTIISRSLEDLYTACLNSVFTVILVIALLLLFTSAILWVIHNQLRKKAKG